MLCMLYSLCGSPRLCVWLIIIIPAGPQPGFQQSASQAEGAVNIN
jgi:hypothetical protein